MGSIYLITGAAGNLGSSVARELASRHCRIRALVLPNDKSAQRLVQGIELIEGDVLNKSDLMRFFDVEEGLDIYVIHTAGIVTTYWEFVQKVYDVNVNGTRNVVEQCIASKVKKLVYVSSVHAIPELPHGQVITEVNAFDPKKIVGFYGKTKAEASQIVMDAVCEYNLNASIIFPSGLCGPYDYAKGHVTQLLIDGSHNRLPMGVHGGYDFVDVRDVAKGIVECCMFGRKGEGYILSNRYVPVEEILHLVHEKTGAKLVKYMAPMWLLSMLVPLFRWYYKSKKRPPIFTKYSLYTLKSNSQFCCDKAKRELGYKARPFEQTITDALCWVKSEDMA